jgi:myo-inositol 2-dehydrogenase/D-chiro-inositol 1-dehydrogenase
MIGFVRRFVRIIAMHAPDQAGARSDGTILVSRNARQNDPMASSSASAHSGGILLDMSVHDIDGALAAPRAARVYATGTIAIHEGLAACNDVDNAVAIIEFEGGAIATLYASRTFAHGHESMTEIVGTAGRLAVGANPRLNRVEIADAHGIRNECTPTFYERFEEAFLRETIHFVDAVLDNKAPALTLHDATEATRIGIALRESLRSRRVVEL